jgi:hypothetical protein
MAGINFIELSMTRKEGDPVALGLEFPATIRIDHQVADGIALFKLVVAIDRPDIVASVGVVVQYQHEDTSPLRDPAVCRVFGEKVAFSIVPIREGENDGHHGRHRHLACSAEHDRSD